MEGRDNLEDIGLDRMEILWWINDVEWEDCNEVILEVVSVAWSMENVCLGTWKWMLKEAQKIWNI
jgi:hypothetical protein